jgi:tetratricopeptide (TPR) repeat protein
MECLSQAPDRVTQDSLQNLDQFDKACKKLIKKPAVIGTRVVVTFFDTQRAMTPYMPSASDVAGFYRPDEDMDHLVTSAESLRASGSENGNPFYHEYAHRFLRQRGFALPAWLDEGVAEYLAAAKFTNANVEFGGVIKRRLQCLREKDVPTLRELFAWNHADRNYTGGERRPAFYAEAWLLVHYLMRDAGDDPAARLSAILDLGNDPKTVEEQLEKLTKLSIPELEETLKRYALRNRVWTQFRLNGEVEASSVAVPVPADPDEVEIALMNLKARLHPDSFDGARMLELAEHPAVAAHAYEVLGWYAAFNDGDRRQAEVFWEKAIEGGSQHAFVYLQLAKARLRSATSLSSLDFRAPDGVADPLRRLLDRALQLDPENAEAWECLAQLEAFAENPRAGVLENALLMVPKMKKQTGTLTALAIYRWRSGKPEKSLEILDQLNGSSNLSQDVRRQIRRLRERLESAEWITSSAGNGATDALRATVVPST